MARAKQTNRAEARKRYRQATAPTDPGLDEAADAAPATTAATRTGGKLPAPKPSTSNVPQRPGILGAFRNAYRPANLRDDLRHLSEAFGHWSFLVGVGLVVVGALAAYAAPNYTGGQFALQLLVLPGSGLGPLLLTGFFARRASYILGFVLGMLQVLALAILLPRLVGVSGTALAESAASTFVTQSAITGPVSGALYAAAAAWYRRFLRESSPRRQTQPGRPGAKQAPKRSTARR